MNDFYIILPSNSNSLTHSENQANKYIVSWEAPVILDDLSKWKVALSEFSYTHSTWTIRPGHKIQLLHTYMGSKQFNVTVHVNFTFGSAGYGLDEVPEECPKVDYEYFYTNRYIKFTYEKPFVLKFGIRKDAEDLGFDHNKLQYNSVKVNDGQYELIAINKLNKHYGGVDVNIQFEAGHIYTEEKQYTFYESFAYTTVPQFVNAMKPIFKKVVGDIAMNDANVLQIIPDKINPVAKVYGFEHTISVTVKFLNGLHHVLGFRNNAAFLIQSGDDGNIRTLSADFRPVLFQSINHMYIYASICKPIQVGNIQAPLLKTIWIQPSNAFAINEVRNIIFDNEMYVPVNNNTFNSIEVNIRLDSGELVPFNHGSKSSLTLHFKRDV